jgi:hypothetical protein
MPPQNTVLWHIDQYKATLEIVYTDARWQRKDKAKIDTNLCK